MKDLLELETRRKIFDLVKRNPGLHLSKISELLNMRVSLIEYHLIYLEKNNVIASMKESGYTRYYIKDKIGIVDKKVLSILRQEIPLRIVLYLLKKVIAQHKEILNQFDIAPSTLSYHLKKLVISGIVDVRTFGEDRGYSVNDRELILQLIIQYKPYSVIEGFKDIWLDLTVD